MSGARLEVPLIGDLEEASTQSAVNAAKKLNAPVTLLFQKKAPPERGRVGVLGTRSRPLGRLRVQRPGGRPLPPTLLSPLVVAML